MSRFYKAEGIVLKRNNTGEADRIITLFTREFGKVRLLAKGIRRITSRRSGHLELFSHVTVSVRTGKGIDLITEASRVDNPRNNGNANMRQVGFAYYFCELVDQLTAERQEHEEVFILLSQSLLDIFQNGFIEFRKHAHQFTLELLWRLGYLPRSVVVAENRIHAYVEHITERKLKTPAILTTMNAGA